MKFNLKNLIQILNKYHPANPQIRQLNYDSFYASVVEFAEGFEKEIREIMNYENKANRPFVSSVEIIKEILGES